MTKLYTCPNCKCLTRINAYCRTCMDAIDIGKQDQLKTLIKELEKDSKYHEKEIKFCSNKQYCKGIRDKCDGLIEYYQRKLEKIK